jgi:CheY-like chemotaxis protein
MTNDSFKKMSVLVVDDDESIRELCRKALTNHDLDVTAAENGEDALKKIQRRMFDIVLTDLSLPIVSGLELLKEIRKSVIIKPL